MKQFNGKLITRIVIPVFLVVIWIFSISRFIAIEDLGFLSLDDRFRIDQLTEVPIGEILKGDIISGKFETPFPNLGIVGFRFLNLNRINNDQLEFRLKQDGDTDWYYRANYKTDQFQPNKIFPLGFKPVSDSNGKMFYFELESLNGVIGNAVAISRDFPTYIGRHVFDKSTLLQNKRLLLYFIYHKTTNLFSNPKFAGAFIAYSLPLLFYLFFVVFGLVFHLPIFLVFLTILIDIFLIPDINDPLVAAIIFAWLLPVIKFRIESKVSWSLAIGLLLTTTFFNLFGLIGIAEKAAFWSFMFFATAAVVQVIEFKAKPKHSVDYNTFWTGCRKGIELLYLIIIGEITIAIKEAGRTGNSFLQPNPRTALLLMLYRLGKPISTTRVYTSRLYSLVIFLLVHTIRSLIRYGPYVLFGGLLWKQINNLLGYLNLYQEFYIENQSQFFWSNTGNYLALFLSVLLSIYFLIVVLVVIPKRLNLRITALIAVLFLFVSINVARKIFNHTSSFQYGVIIWSVSPNDSREPWVDVTIGGRNFSDLPFVGKVYIDGVEQRVIHWSDKEVVFRTNPSTTRSGKITIVTAEDKKSNRFDFSYSGNR